MTSAHSATNRERRYSFLGIGGVDDGATIFALISIDGTSTVIDAHRFNTSYELVVSFFNLFL